MNQYEQYWEENIEKFGGFYDATSTETVSNNKINQILYEKLIFPMERAITINRMSIISRLIEEYVDDQQTKSIADIGCGNGIFSEYLSNKFKAVYAIDFTQKAIELTKARSTSIKTILLDIEKSTIPINTDIGVALGLTPYVDIEKFFDNTLPTTDMLIYQILDSSNIFNQVRILLPSLNVRNYKFYTSKEISYTYSKHGFELTHREKCGTSFIEIIKRM